MTSSTNSPATDTTLPKQLCLPGQAAAPEGPVDMLMMYVLHHGFRRTLDDFAAAVPVTPVADRSAWTAMARYWAGFASILHEHHTNEDSFLWPVLYDRVDAAGDTAGRATLAAMEAEHEEIDPLLVSCERGLSTMAAGGTEDVRAALTVRVAAGRDALDRHLAHEETAAIELIQRHLSADDWHTVEAQFPKPPLRGMPFGVPWACAGLPAVARNQAFKSLPGAFRVVWWLTRPRFERFRRRAFGYAVAA